MNNKTKILIGSGIALLIIAVTLLFLFKEENDTVKVDIPLLPTSITPQEFAKESLALAENAIEKIRVANTKYELINIFKETLPPLIDMIPEALAGVNQYINNNGGAESMIKEFNDDPDKALAKYLKDFEEVTGKYLTFVAIMEDLEDDRGLEDRMEKIFESMTDLDYAEIVQFTVPEYTKMIEGIASNDDALTALNSFIDAMSPEFTYEFPDEEKYRYQTEWGWETDWESYDADIKEVPYEPIVLTQEKLLSLSKTVEDSYKGAKTERDFERASKKVEEAMEKLMGRNLF